MPAPMGRSQRTRSIAVLVLALVAASACSSSSGSGDAPPTRADATSTSTTTATTSGTSAPPCTTDAATAAMTAGNRALGIVCGGNFDSQYNPTGRQPTAQQIHALLCLTLHLTGAVEDPRIPPVLFNALSCGPHDLYAHADFGKPACPGATLTALLGSFRVHRPVGRAQRADDAMHNDRQWQKALVARGYDLGMFGLEHDGVDGDWGPSSRRALIKFQTDSGLTPSGHRDGPTEAALFGGN